MTGDIIKWQTDNRTEMGQSVAKLGACLFQWRAMQPITVRVGVYWRVTHTFYPNIDLLAAMWCWATHPNSLLLFWNPWQKSSTKVYDECLMKPCFFIYVEWANSQKEMIKGGLNNDSSFLRTTSKTDSGLVVSQTIWSWRRLCYDWYFTEMKVEGFGTVFRQRASCKLLWGRLRRQWIIIALGLHKTPWLAFAGSVLLIYHTVNEFPAVLLPQQPHRVEGRRGTPW